MAEDRPPPSSPTTTPAVLLIVRFTADIPDLPLPIANPKTTTTLSLKQLIRARIPAAHAASRLRLIHAGKVLADTAPLTSSLGLPPPPPPRARPPESDAKGKGKQRAREEDADGAEPRRVYIHCSIGDALTPSALAAEASAAASAEAALASAFASASSQKPGGGAGRGPSSSGLPADGAAGSSAGAGAGAGAGGGSRSTTQAPQGFDRLLSAGFTAAEVQQLRSQFRANLSFTHTPDTMPSADEIRVLEDRWLDNDNMGGGRPGAAVGEEGGEAGGGGAGAAGGWGTATWSDNGGLDDMLYGNVVGFFWPLGALGWGFREEGVWSRRRQIAVLTGFLLNVIFGFLRLSG